MTAGLGTAGEPLLAGGRDQDSWGSPWLPSACPAWGPGALRCCTRPAAALVTTPLTSQARGTRTLPVLRGTRSQVTSALPSRALFYPIDFRKTFKKSEEVRNHRVFVLEEKTKSLHLVKYMASEHRLSPEPSAPSASSQSGAGTR